MVLAAFGDAAFKFWLGKFAFQFLLREAAAARPRAPGGRTGPAGRVGPGCRRRNGGVTVPSLESGAAAQGGLPTEMEADPEAWQVLGPGPRPARAAAAAAAPGCPAA
jgi:hypothetical protein